VDFIVAEKELEKGGWQGGIEQGTVAKAGKSCRTS